MDEINNRKADLDDKVNALQRQIDDVQSQLNAANARLAAVTAQAEQAQAQLDVAQAALALSTQQMQDRAVDAYVGKDKSPSLADFVLKANDMRQLSAAGEYMHQVVADRKAIVEQHRELEGQAKDLANQVAEAKADAAAARDVIAKRSAELASQKGELDTLHAEVQKEADNQNALLAEVETKRESLQAQVDSLQAQSDSIAAQLRSAGGTGTPPPAGKGVLANPVPGAYMTSPFGMRLDPVLNRYQLHAGQDFGVASGTPIHAGADGTVVTLLPESQSGGYGNYTCISHGNGLATCYAHQSQFMVTMGQHVTRNQIIGLSGSTGYSTGPHLHWEVRINGNPVNPVPYL